MAITPDADGGADRALPRASSSNGGIWTHDRLSFYFG
jgi:hypothetical protein